MTIIIEHDFCAVSSAANTNAATASCLDSLPFQSRFFDCSHHYMVFIVNFHTEFPSISKRYVEGAVEI